MSTPLVAFSAAKTSVQAAWEGQTIEFSEVLTNIGDAYAYRTSVFTCPYSGVYMFHVHLASNGDECVVKINKDDTQLFGVYAAWYHDIYYNWIYNTASNSMIVHCDEGSKVSVKAFRNSICEGDADQFSSFSGHFLGFNTNSTNK